MREKPEEVHEIGRKTRITPACAGKNLIDESTFIKTTHHPRVCGKNAKEASTTVSGSGSPPRVREKLNSQLTMFGASRITPACAGKTWLQRPHGIPRRDHPRVCGKNSSCSLSRRTLSGSPPRVREKRVIYPVSLRHGGITPACAGKTVSDYPTNRLNGDHPRVCGKNLDIVWDFKPELGSPPRVREKPIKSVLDGLANGITPACAGKTVK